MYNILVTTEEEKGEKNNDFQGQRRYGNER